VIEVREDELRERETAVNNDAMLDSGELVVVGSILLMTSIGSGI
jgi:hypothetical protein